MRICLLRQRLHNLFGHVRVRPRTLDQAIARLSTRDGRGQDAKALRAWLVEKANERELPGRSKAA
jgi:hypothetical protein